MVWIVLQSSCAKGVIPHIAVSTGGALGKNLDHVDLTSPADQSIGGGRNCRRCSLFGGSGSLLACPWVCMFFPSPSLSLCFLTESSLPFLCHILPLWCSASHQAGSNRVSLPGLKPLQLNQNKAFLLWVIMSGILVILTKSWLTQHYSNRKQGKNSMIIPVDKGEVFDRVQTQSW